MEFKGPDGQHLADAQPRRCEGCSPITAAPRSSHARIATRSALGDERLVFSGHMAVHGLFDFLMNNHALPGCAHDGSTHASWACR